MKINLLNKFKSPIIIGLEIHVQLNTNTKLFCGCSTKEHTLPNNACCEICLGHPGSKPVLNIKAVEFGLRLAHALDCSIADELIFSRKSYFYPDLAKNYQISQFELPLGKKGHFKLSTGKKINITRIHLEEDPASLVHTDGIEESSFSLIDYNRSGIPLIEIVTEPELNSPEEARDFMKRLITILKYLKIYDPNTCVIKADANISIRESGYVRSEIKNITGFKEIERALFYELERHKQAVNSKEKLKQDTRTWNAEKGYTTLLRLKETEADYGYIFDPDLVSTELNKAWVKKVKDTLPELPEQKIKKFISEHKIPKTDAEVIAAEHILATLFEKVAKEVDPQLAAKWLRRELMRVVHYNNIDLDNLKIDELHLIELLSMVEKKEITENVAQKIMEKLVIKPFSPREYVDTNKLSAISDQRELEALCQDTINENPKVIEEFKKGKIEALNFLVGQIMRKTKGKADAKLLKEMLVEKIK